MRKDKQKIFEDAKAEIDKAFAKAYADLAALDKEPESWHKPFKVGDPCFLLCAYGEIECHRYGGSLRSYLSTNSLFHTRAEAERELLERRSRVKTCAWPVDDWQKGCVVAWNGNILSTINHARMYVYIFYPLGRFHMTREAAEAWRDEFQDKLAEEPK